jgi:hypothetical protein
VDNVAKLPTAVRREIFELVAAQRGLHPAIMEKDFWVCWVLKKLFASEELRDHLVFKGGTALSKVDGMIDRFSEDIDLVLDWGLLGYGKDGEDAWKPHASNTQQDKFNKKVNAKADRYLREELCPQLRKLFNLNSYVQVAVSDEKQLTINIKPPSAFSLKAIRPDVKLEIGPLASRVPSREAVVRPYAAEDFPSFFEDPDCPVIAIRAERTFWEKATILHQQAYRVSTMPMGYSRHYYDLVQMMDYPVCSAALADLELLEDVIRFKQRFYPSPWARYDLARPGSFQLMPTESGQKELEQDYRQMRPMFFSDPPTWRDLQRKLGELESNINDLQPIEKDS